jgi:aminodeoxyfutalosine deaminase
LYRKFSADHIFNGYQMLEQQVLVTDAEGVVIEIVAEPDAGDDIKRFSGILCPGFINAHCHLELAHLKGHIPKHTGLVDFVFKVINERHFAEAEILNAFESAETGMIQEGIVAVGDICNNTLTIPQKVKHNLAYYNFIEASGFPPPIAAARFQRANDILTAYKNAGLAASIVPHAPYSVSPELFKLINEQPESKLLTIHNQEAEFENEFFEKGTGDLLRLYRQLGVVISFFEPTSRTSLQTWLPYFTQRQTIIAVHNVHTSEADLRFTQRQTTNNEHQTFFCLCPNANLYISDKLPDVHMLMKNTADIVLGTDSLASNDRLSILEEMRTLQDNFDPGISTLLRWATTNGARALQMDEQFGSFEKGKKPGLVLIDGVVDMKLSEQSKVRRIL